MIYLELFLTFFEVGAFLFGGGYGMISLIRELCLGKGWLDDGELLNMIAVAESTPGPIAVNMATFVGISQGGILGAVCATVGVVLPSFVLILMTAALLSKLMKYAGVKATLGGIRPAIIGMILATACITFLSVVFKIETVGNIVAFDWKALCIFIAICTLSFGYKKWKRKVFSHILLIILSGVLGILVFGV